MSGRTCVFIVDDDPTQLIILAGILRAAGHTTEVFERPAALLARLSPDDRGCVVMDLQMPGVNGLALQKALGERGAHLPVVFVSGSADIPDAVAAMKQGALDFLKKPVKPEALRTMVAQALQKDAHAATERATKAHATAAWATLSARERDVCRLFAKGLIVKQIASTLSISDSTTHTHRVRGMQKLRIDTVVELSEFLHLADQGSASRE